MGVRPPRRGWTLAFMALKACFQSDRNDDGQSGRAATGPDDIHTKISQRFPKQLSWVPCDRTKGLEGADRRLKHPGSRYMKIKHLRNFRECFFLAREHGREHRTILFFRFHAIYKPDFCRAYKTGSHL